MANNTGDAHQNHDFIDQLFDMQSYSPDPNLPGTGVNLATSGLPMMLHLSSNASGGFHAPPVYPLGLNLDQGKTSYEGSSSTAKRFRDYVLDAGPNNVFHGHPMPSPVPAAVAPHQAGVRPRVRARRGQATDPHSIAERLRRERIAERIRALQELVPSVNKSDRAAMLDEIVDYVKFLRLQVKVLSMSRLGGAGAVVPLVTDMSISSVEDESGEGQLVWEKWSNDGTERQVAKLMEENVGAAMQFLQSKALCIMPISLASAIYHSQPPDADAADSHIKPDSNPPS